VKPSTIYDVAREAGVSHQTVTRYLRGYEGIRDATKQRVEKAIARLEYRPNTAARQLRLRTTNRVAVLADRIGQGGPALIVRGVTERLQQRGYVSDIIAVDGQDLASVDAAIDLATEYQVAGILATAQTDIVLDRLRSRPIAVPMVIDAQIVDPISGELVGQLAGVEAAQHLLELGHRKIGYVAGPSGWLATRDRQNGFVSTVEAAGATVAWVREGDWTGASGYKAWQMLDEDARNITAIGVANDTMAMGIMAALSDDGRSVPDDVSVVGTDDTDEGRFVRPALTTVQLDFEGRQIAQRLVNAISDSRSGEGGGEAFDEVLHPPRLISRASTSVVSELGRPGT